MDLLEEYRKEIDAIDNEILKLLAKRLQITEKIGAYKKEKNISVIDKSREHEIIKILTNEGKALHLSDTFIKDVWQIIFRQAYRSEEK